MLGAEVRDGVRPEDVGRKEAVDHLGEAVLPYVLPLAVSEGFGCVVPGEEAR